MDYYCYCYVIDLCRFAHGSVSRRAPYSPRTRTLRYAFFVIAALQPSTFILVLPPAGVAHRGYLWRASGGARTARGHGRLDTAASIRLRAPARGAAPTTWRAGVRACLQCISFNLCLSNTAGAGAVQNMFLLPLSYIGHEAEGDGTQPQEGGGSVSLHLTSQHLLGRRAKGGR